jgi:CelD/BcsL family acetyltransferase involved in cellulose biosynthesis
MVAGFNADGELVGLAPLAVSQESFAGVSSTRILRLMGDGTWDSDNLDMPVRPGYERAFAELVLSYLHRERRAWDICELNTLPQDSPVAGAILEICNARRWRSFQHSSDSSAIFLPDTWEQYLQRLSTEDARNIARYSRRLRSRHAVRIFRCTQVSELSSCLQALFQLHQQRWQSVGEPGSFSSVERREFYYELSRALLGKGWLELWGLEVEGKLSAVQFAFRYRDRVFQLQEGFDRQRSSDRLGLVLRAYVLEQLIAEQVRIYDFLGGEDSYKARWGALPSRYRTLRFALPFTRGSVLLWFVENAEEHKSWLRRRLPPGAWNMLKKVNRVVRGRCEVSPVSLDTIA